MIALAMTALVYGAVALLVKIDDIGLRMARGDAPAKATPACARAVDAGVFRVISITYDRDVVGRRPPVIANLAEVGWHAPLDALHAVEHSSPRPVVVWLGDTLVSAIAGSGRTRDRPHRPVIGKAFGKNLSFSEGHDAAATDDAARRARGAGPPSGRGRQPIVTASRRRRRGDDARGIHHATSGPRRRAG